MPCGETPSFEQSMCSPAPSAGCRCWCCRTRPHRSHGYP